LQVTTLRFNLRITENLSRPAERLWSCGTIPEFYEGLLARGMKPELARVTLARKIAAITLTLWKKGEHFDAKYVKSQAA
jgi:hypothetical protein